MIADEIIIVMGKAKILGMGTTVISLVNGMIGGSILIIPKIALEGGWAMTLLIVVVTAFFSYFTCFVTMIHLGDQRDLDHTIQRHFNGNRPLKWLYDFSVWSGIFLAMVLYFNLIVIQWEGLVPPYEYIIYNPIINGVFLLAWVVLLKFFEFGAHIMGYGIVSIVAYLVFLVWVIVTAPGGGTSFPAVGSGIAGFAALMSNAFSIQGIFIPIMICHPTPTNYNRILVLTFTLGAAAYFYIAYLGAFGKLGTRQASATAPTATTDRQSRPTSINRTGR